jgi:tetratricopeptide (TPR) repeat protein
MLRIPLLFTILSSVCLTLVATAEEPKDANGYANRGQDWKMKREYDKAIADYTEAIRLDPHSDYFYLLRSMAWDAKGEYAKAMADCNEAVRLDPRNSSNYVCRGQVWIELKKIDNALNDFDQASRLDPKYATPYICRGMAWHAKGDFAKAIEAYNQAMQIDPKDMSAYYYRGLSRVAKREYDQALDDFDRALRLDAKDEQAWNGKAWLEATCPDAEHRDAKLAVEHATKACQFSDWKEPAMLDSLAAAYAESGDFANAVKWQTKARDLAPAVERADFQTRLDLYKAHKPCRDVTKK